MKHLFLTILLLLSVAGNKVLSQTVIEIKPLFEYPVAPEDQESLVDKCNYLVRHFWENFDFKNKQPVDQYALNEAFQVYTTPMRYANKKEVDQSVDKLIGKISGNSLMLLQFMKAAEENLYGPRADFWSDDLYLKFLDAIIKNKKISDSRKSRYIQQASTIRSSSEGSTAPSFDFTDVNGNLKNYFPMSTPTLIIIGDPEDTDWRLARLKLESNFKLSDALEKGKVNILYIIPTLSENWEKMVSNYNSHWSVGLSADISKQYDVRVLPSIYLVGSDGKILFKNISLQEAVDSLLGNLN